MRWFRDTRACFFLIAVICRPCVLAVLLFYVYFFCLFVCLFYVYFCVYFMFNINCEYRYNYCRAARAATLRALHSTHMMQLAPHHWCCYIDGQGINCEGTCVRTMMCALLCC
jgi:hypothetical protein